MIKKKNRKYRPHQKVTFIARKMRAGDASSVSFGSRYASGSIIQLRPETILQSPVRTLADMTDAEKAAIEARCHAKIKT